MKIFALLLASVTSCFNFEVCLLIFDCLILFTSGRECSKLFNYPFFIFEGLFSAIATSFPKGENFACNQRPRNKGRYDTFGLSEVGRDYALSVKDHFYLPIRMRRTLMSLGDTPGIRLACARVSGSIRISFCLPSVEIS